MATNDFLGFTFNLKKKYLELPPNAIHEPLFRNNSFKKSLLIELL